MKKFIKTVKDYIQSKIDKYVVKRFQQIFPKELIRSLYRRIAEDELQITTKEIEVKKGKIRYTLLVIKDKGLKTVFNLGRHFEDKPKIRETA
jgi:hypothetical protein